MESLKVLERSSCRYLLYEMFTRALISGKLTRQKLSLLIIACRDLNLCPKWQSRLSRQLANFKIHFLSTFKVPRQRVFPSLPHHILSQLILIKNFTVEKLFTKQKLSQGKDASMQTKLRKLCAGNQRSHHCE